MSKNKKQQQDKNIPGNDQQKDQENNNQDKGRSKPTAVNEDNLVNSGRVKNRTELHTKNAVTGSDSDGQAD